MALHLLDTNILFRAAHIPDPQHLAIRAFLTAGIQAGDTYTFASQNGIEAWGVLTRPATANGGYGLSPHDAAQTLKRIGSVFARLPDTDDVYPQWLDLVEHYGVSGKQVHDARLVAVMLTAGIDRIITLNDKDFLRFAPEGIVAINPITAQKGPPAGGVSTS